MSSAPSTILTGPHVILTFQLDPVKLVETDVKLPPPGAYTGNKDDPEPKPKTRFLTNDSTLVRGKGNPLHWNAKPGPEARGQGTENDKEESAARGQGIKAFALALVRMKYLLQINGDLDDSDVLLAGGSGSPAITFAGVMDYRSADPLTWLGEFCGFLKLTGTPRKCSLAPWFKVRNRTRNQDGTSLQVRCGTSKISGANLQIVIHDPAGALREATDDELLVIACALAEPPEWRVRDSLTFPPAARPIIAPLPPPAPPTAPRLTDDALLAHFRPSLISVAEKCEQVELRGIKLSGNPTLRLAHVYASLETDSPRTIDQTAADPRETGGIPKNRSALEALLDPVQNRVVLVGEPGSGKSTFLQYVTLYLADKLSAHANSKFAGVTEIDPLLRAHQAIPVRIPLHDLARSLTASQTGTSEDVFHHVQSLLVSASHAAAQHLREILTRGLALVMFDGLDEVPGDRLPVVKRAIESFASGGFRQCRVAVTCRIASYKKKNSEFKLSNFSNVHTLAPLSTELRDRFVTAWYRELAETRTEYRREAVSTAKSLIRALDTERLIKMAGNPFFLTAMAALHRPEKPLPNSSAELMNELVDGILNDARKRRSDGEGKDDLPAILTLLEAKKIDNGVKRLREQLQAIAYLAREARQSSGPTAKLVDDKLIRGCLLEIGNVDRDWVNQMILAMQHRAGVLQSNDGKSFEFPYKFEEFLAGCHLAREDFWKDQDDPQPFDQRSRRLLQAQGDYARLVIQWAAGVKTYVQTDRGDVRDLVDELVSEVVTTDPKSLDDLELAAEIARDVGMANWGDNNPRRSPEVVARLVNCFTEVRDGAFDIATRARAASAIGRFGDPRDGVGLDAAKKFPKLAWIALPKGPFIMGSKPGVGYDRERPQLPKCGLIEQPYRISRYPVTELQYAAFVDDDGYAAKHKTCWTQAGWDWREQKKITGPLNNETDPVFQTPNHPRVGVSWYEAFAFCRWLTDKLRTANQISAKERVRLPTEAEWERAARHTDGRTYPWGKEVKGIAKRCNMSETGLNKTSAVGLFPKGRAECGAEDMAGNVWEWCLTPWLSDYARYETTVKPLEADLEAKGARVVRGGWWFNYDPNYLPASYRFYYEPEFRDYVLGFRCVLAGVSAGGGSD